MNEEFSFTVIISSSSLEDLTICDLAFSDKPLGDYVRTFISSSDNPVIHYVDFRSFGYSEGDDFWVLIYAIQTQNSKMEFKYPIITGKVGKVSGMIKIERNIEGESEYYKSDFKIKSSGNYFYYDFQNIPTGNVASLRINSAGEKVSKVICLFTSEESTEEDMIKTLNEANLLDINYCIGENYYMNNTVFNALINANDIYTNNLKRLIIQILFEIKEGDEISNNNNSSIILENTGTNLASEGQYTNPESYTLIPYVVDLSKIKNSKSEEYISKILFYSNTRQIEIFYLKENKQKPISLFNGNIIVVNTDEDYAKQNYGGSTTLILLSDSLSTINRNIFGEQYRFITYFFNSDNNINYFISSNNEGRPLNSPIPIEINLVLNPIILL